ncbi:NAD(P)/FAD-dependent oxidoreductase [Aromatoleum anaerobium]|uniref:Aminoacetone oxidase family FAD-binding enzyme n=1 Tax=Aromatoleum anaerobium TaxID=182180 RepID=A0ABX1PJW1_9RHOO|nr:NAD(P)/FAD-dependent oxidoreductase [Aromatoleum anaerobium]
MLRRFSTCRATALAELNFDVIVIGAGAAGMMCAAQAGQRGRKVLIIDHAEKLAEKIRISGGGRCNFTNRRVGPENFLSRNPHFARSALARYGSVQFIELVERHGIRYHERNLGQLFCDESAQQIIDMLRAECEDGGVRFAMPLRVEAVARQDDALARFAVDTARGRYTCTSLVIASGGLSIPKIGATPFGYRIAEQFGIPVVPPRPALVPLTLPPETLQRFASLAGASLDIEAQCNGERFREAALITHRGLSGPVVLQVSSYWQAQAYDDEDWAPVCFNLLPGIDAQAWLEQHAGERGLLANLLAERLPRRFAHAWCALHGWERPLNQFRPAELKVVATALSAWEIMPSGTQGYAKAEVTLGGVDTRALSSKTMEASTCKGLHFIGEVMDITGHLGGFNFQWAWSSGHAAGQFV